jgi:hypothetical protein
MFVSASQSHLFYSYDRVASIIDLGVVIDSKMSFFGILMLRTERFW